MLPVAQWLQLPQEVLMEIFLYLSPVEKTNVRATCSYFKVLIDHPALWKKSTIVLESSTTLNDEFWEMLQNRKIRSIEVKKMKTKQWKKLTTSMPELLNLTIGFCLTQENLLDLRPLTNLKKLHLQDCSGLLDVKVFIEIAHYGQLTHLSLCNLQDFLGVPLNALAYLKNLLFLSLHTKHGPLNPLPLQFALFHLPKLQELSLTVRLLSTWALSKCFILPKAIDNQVEELSCIPRLQLQKLELIDFGHSGLSENALDQLSTLQTISLQNYRHKEGADFLNIMLKKLPNLSEINLVGSSSLDLYCIPPELEKFCALRTKINNETLCRLSVCARNLKYLDLSFSYGFDVCYLTKFPLLAKLYLRNINFSRETLVVLASMKSLQAVYISSNQLLTPEAILEFQSMTANRVHIIVDELQAYSLCCCQF
ncbi:uncharacterized protein LOC115089970 [Rhinatrema bivittatum]|uniref:uncharacterized protein LOC115089970 n=1 Tax=Rhinatrema bivittatum TaxID=194408 RepID=UPI0011295B35|nr:uncharacterized protein LOC115089970 [Rhinatrema bivittatum]XP_029454321.1 uncharacterized protein LOC115089970 [Rhinatrema bivittatum]